MNLPKNLEAHESGNLVWSIAEAADDRKAENIVLLQVNEVSYLADFFVVATGFSRTQVRAIADSIEDKLEKEFDKTPLRTEGRKDGTWILQDYGEVIVHVFLPQEREFYNLEAFWGHAERIEYQPALS
ncbi:iojap-like protein [[Leptolyngbya] sp. PCC 7376]|uniref:ribosome silencing factor n=1 Tax=[Leptolyngbya] sp. PCC 7376 TaxID=111781 RepID=UPI00029EE318|nr:ribosome silencing factor [[Leptolyngbya] sp. PCC 7376]AFY39062.1 iojap-like protein [[Leptolyngbya] sp. PCC 7376]